MSNTTTVPCVTPPSVSKSMRTLASLSIPSLSTPQQERHIISKKRRLSIGYASLKEVEAVSIPLDEVFCPSSPPRIQNTYQTSSEPFKIQLRQEELLAPHFDDTSSANAQLPSGSFVSPKAPLTNLENPPTLNRERIKYNFAEFEKENESNFFFPDLKSASTKGIFRLQFRRRCLKPLSFNASTINEKHLCISPSSVQWSLNR